MLHDLKAFRAAASKVTKEVSSGNIVATVSALFDSKENDELSFTANLLDYYSQVFPVLTPDMIKDIKKQNAEHGIKSDSLDPKLAYRYRKFAEMVSNTGFYGYWKSIGSEAFNTYVVRVIDQSIAYNEAIAAVRKEIKEAKAVESMAGAANDAELTARVAGINNPETIEALRNAAKARAIGYAFDAAGEIKSALGSCVKKLLAMRDIDAQQVMTLLEATFRSARATQIDADHATGITMNGAFEKMDEQPAERTGTN